MKDKRTSLTIVVVFTAVFGQLAVGQGKFATVKQLQSQLITSLRASRISFLTTHIYAFLDLKREEKCQTSYILLLKLSVLSAHHSSWKRSKPSPGVAMQLKKNLPSFISPGFRSALKYFVLIVKNSSSFVIQNN